jgi:hypothetical protein
MDTIQRIVHFGSAMASESTINRMSARRKKKFKSFPLFFMSEILKRPFWATWSCDGVGISIVVVFIVVVVDLLSKTKNDIAKRKK